MAKVTFLPNRIKSTPIEIEAKEGDTLLELAQDHGVPVGYACGGVCACSTCHVQIQQGAENLTEMEENENDRLDLAFDVVPESRLGCQAKICGRGDIVVKISEESLETWENEHH